MLPTYDTYTMAINDASTYDTSPVNPRLKVEVPSFGTAVDIPFNVNGTTIVDSTTLGITVSGFEQSLPDGIYCLTYSIAPPDIYFVNKTIMRVDKLHEKFDAAFMKLDMMECDKALKMQAKVTLCTIYFLIQGSIASANNCDDVGAMTLYKKASNMLDTFIKNDCGCSGNTYIINFS